MEREQLANYFELLNYWAEIQPEKDFLVVDTAHLSYQAFYQRVQNLAKQAKSVGIAARMDILLLADTVTDQLAGFLAAMCVGARPILLHHGLSEQEVQEILQANQLAGLWKLTADDAKFLPTGLPANYHEEKNIFGVLSSGSTGTPKVMYRTYFSWAGFFSVQNKIFLVSRETKLFLHGSLSFTGNLNSLLSVLYAGGTIVTSAKFAIHRWEQLLIKENVTCLYLVPTKLSLLTQHNARQEKIFPMVASIFTGSQLLTADGIRALQKSFPQARLFLYYGASELNYITYAEVTDPNRNPENLGKPFPGIQLTIRDGLIYVNSPYHVSGLKLPACIRDTGYLNEQGELIFTGRRENWINKGGVKISAEHLRQKLLQIHGITDAFVLPVADPKRGMTAVAWLVTMEQTEKEMRQTIRHALPPVEIPDKLFFLSELPLNDRGKIDRKKLLETLV